MIQNTDTSNLNWRPVELPQWPNPNTVVYTKIDDGKGVRNIQKLLFSDGLWWLPDKSMYVYYSPTHWASI